MECYVFIWKWELKEFQGFLGLLDLLILILVNGSLVEIVGIDIGEIMRLKYDYLAGMN